VRLKADQEVSSFCCAGLSRIDASILGRMKTSREMAFEKCSKPEAYCLSPLSGQKITKDRLRTEVGIGING
jgi:hypothetical protein